MTPICKLMPEGSGITIDGVDHEFTCIEFRACNLYIYTAIDGEEVKIEWTCPYPEHPHDYRRPFRVYRRGDWWQRLRPGYAADHGTVHTVEFNDVAKDRVVSFVDHCWRVHDAAMGR